MKRRSNFSTWKARLTAAEYDAIVAHLNKEINKNNIHNASWMASPEWEKTPLQVIYTKACLMNEEAAAKFFGLAVWETMINRPEKWCFDRFEGDDLPDGLTYFQV